MNRIIFTVAIVLQTVVTLGQAECQTAIPFIDNWCYSFSPATSTVTRCFTFTSPADSIDFTFVPFVPQGTCGDAFSFYTLYDVNCAIDTTNLDGLFIGLQPNFQYVVCYTIQCPTTGVVNFLCTSELIVLPIELLYFTGESGYNSISLRWETATEVDCERFEIYRSSDASRWTLIGSIEGAGNSQQVLSYRFDDLTPQEGINYYQLIQYDLDGDFEILQTIAVAFNREVVLDPFWNYNRLGQRIR
jgi:hypothetical protein